METGQRVSYPERFVFEPPTAFGVPEAGQRVGHRVEVGTDAQAVPGEVVADIGYDGEPAGPQGVSQRPRGGRRRGPRSRELLATLKRA